ncbi:MAG: DUF134 domain-containing protein [archaeon]|nr:DUF134 domain-containing protein [archaeon]
MPRPRCCRRVGFRPDVTYFKPAGIRKEELEESILNIDEFEAVRLKDLLDMEQGSAAEEMNISQPTFHRLILSARKKIADAIINAKAIKIEGGNFKIAETEGRMGRGMGFGSHAINCVCPNCRYGEEKIIGVPCASKKCPKCGTLMIRGE